MPNLFISFVCFHPPERLVLEHFLPAFFCILEWAVLRFGFDAVSLRTKIKISIIAQIAPINIFLYLYSFTFSKCLYNRQKVFGLLSVHNKNMYFKFIYYFIVT
nr:MAG TPA: hypothetical protein [Caudoviricetes sp.]